MNIREAQVLIDRDKFLKVLNGLFTPNSLFVDPTDRPDPYRGKHLVPVSVNDRISSYEIHHVVVLRDRVVGVILSTSSWHDLEQEVGAFEFFFVRVVGRYENGRFEVLQCMAHDGLSLFEADSAETTLRLMEILFDEEVPTRPASVEDSDDSPAPAAATEAVEAHLSTIEGGWPAPGAAG